MITIIHHGHAQYNTTCPICDCIFAFEDPDIITVKATKEEYIYCPECNSPIMLTLLNKREYKHLRSLYDNPINCDR